MPPAPRDVALTVRSYILMVLVGATAGFGNVHARFIGPLPPELRSKCVANFEGDLHGQQAAAIEAACSANVADRVYIAAEYLVVTLSLLSLAVCAYAFAGAERRAQRSDSVPRKQALALFLGTDLAALPWVILSPACFMITYWSLVPLEVCRSHGPTPARPRSVCHRCLVHATTPPVPLDRCVKAPTRARAQVIWQRWYCTIVLVLWAYAPAAYILTILLGYYRAFPAGVVVCTGMVIFDGINLPPRVCGTVQFRAVPVHQPMGGRELVSRRGREVRPPVRFGPSSCGVRVHPRPPGHGVRRNGWFGPVVASGGIWVLAAAAPHERMSWDLIVALRTMRVVRVMLVFVLVISHLF